MALPQTPAAPTPRCSLVLAGETCDRDAAWIICVGPDDSCVVCEEHRNAALVQLDAKDVSGIYRIEDLRDDEDDAS